MSNQPKKHAQSRIDQAAQEHDARRRRLQIIGIVGGLALLGVLAIVLAVTLTGDDEPDGPELQFNGVPLPPFVAGESDLALFTPAPIFVTDDLEGNRVVTAGGGGPNDTAKLVGFFAHWCPTCQAEVPRVAQWLEANELPDLVEVIAVSTLADSDRDNYPPDEWFAASSWPTPVLVDSGDGEIGGRFGMPSVPYWVVLDHWNRVLERHSGTLTDEDLQRLVSLAEASFP